MKKIITISFLGIFFISLILPLYSFAQETSTTPAQENYYYYPILEKQNYQNATDGGLKCSQDFSNYVGSIITVPAGFNPDQKLLVCWKNNNDYSFYKTGKSESQHFQDKESCQKESLADRESKYGQAVKNWSVLIGKTITIEDDLKPLYSCTFVNNQTLSSTAEKAKMEENYYPLQVLPGLGEKCTADSKGKTTCVKIAPNCSPDPKDPKKIVCTPALGFAGYLNIMIKIFIGICAVLAMIMIVMGGIQYMTSGLISSKEAAKESITHAILGLLLALGAFAILNTLNPNLLDVSLKDLPTATATLQDEEETPGMAVTGSSGIPPSGPYGGCTEGFEKITTKGGNFYLCKKISASVKTMIDLAWSQGYKLSGGSFRSKQDQINLRVKNCNGDTTNPKAKCNPPTAVPGSSRHESGLAIDFTCEGTLIQTKDNKCFIWLSKNAGNYKLYNFKKEPWHWSFDGK